MFKKILALLSTPASPLNPLIRKLETAYDTKERTKYAKEMAWEEERNQALQFAAHLSLYFDMVPGTSFNLPSEASSFKSILSNNYGDFYREERSVIYICITDGGDIKLISKESYESPLEVHEWSREVIERYTQKITNWAYDAEVIHPERVTQTLHSIAEKIAEECIREETEVKERQAAIEKRKKFFY